MLHEALGSVSQWRDFPEKLAQNTGAEVFLYSRAGHGQSTLPATPRTPDYLHHEACNILPGVLEAAGITRPVLFGHSDGASIALIYAATLPDSPAALILEAPHTFVEQITLDGVAVAGDLYRTSDLAQRLHRHHADPDHVFRAWHDSWLSPAFRAWDIRPLLDSIRCPVLVLQGELDQYGSPEQVHVITRHVPTAQGILIPGCGHSPHRERPEFVLKQVSEFLGALNRSR